MTDKSLIFRPHRGSLDKSMSESFEVYSKDEILNYTQAVYKDFIPPDVEIIIESIEPYYGYDDRISWETHIVIIIFKRKQEVIERCPIGFLSGSPEIWSSKDE